MADSAPAKKSPKKGAKKAVASHPKYSVMIAAAIAGLKERSGSSRQAIEKYILAQYKVGDSVSTHLKLALKRGVASGALKQVKGSGASGSFRINKPSADEPKKTVAKKSAAKKAAAKKPAAKKGTKKPAAKKAAKKTAKKPAAKKTAKKPAAKKTPKKPAAKKPAAKKAAKKPAAKKAAKKPAKK